MSLGGLVLDAVKLASQMRSDGASQAEAAAVIEDVLRKGFPLGREWKYLCTTCRDYGLEMFTCPGDRTCGRDKPHLPHDFGRPCWCSLGQRFKARPRSEEDFQQAGKVQKQRGFTRAGR